MVNKPYFHWLISISSRLKRVKYAAGDPERLAGDGNCAGKKYHKLKISSLELF